MQTNQIELSLSLHGYENKPTNWVEVNYKKTEITVEELINKIKNGYCYTGCYSDNIDVITQHDKTKKNFRYTYLISVDVDDSELSMQDFINTIENKPTFAYTTFNHGIKGNRYRLVYVYNNKITDVNYSANYDFITKSMNLKDNCMKSVNQQSAGTTPNAEIYYNLDKTYDVIECRNESIIRSNIEDSDVTFEIDKTFVCDLMNMSPIDFIQKYDGCCRYITETPLIDTGKGYFLYSDNFYYATRRYYVGAIQRGEETIKMPKIGKFKDGEQRRKKLFKTALILKHITSDLTIEELVFDLVRERLNYYDNSDKVLTNNVLIEIAKRAFETPFDEERLKPCKPHQFTCNKQYWYDRGITDMKVASSIVKGIISGDKIGELYDFTLTDKENIEVFKKYGVNITVKTLQRWRKKNDIPKYKKDIRNNNKKEEEVHITSDVLFEKALEKPTTVITERKTIEEIKADVTMILSIDFSDYSEKDSYEYLTAFIDSYGAWKSDIIGFIDYRIDDIKTSCRVKDMLEKYIAA